MRQQDFVSARRSNPSSRTGCASTLTALGIGIGVTAVVLLTSIGEGLQHLHGRAVHAVRHDDAAGAARQDEHVRLLARRAELGAAAVARGRRGDCSARRTCCTSVPMVAGSASVEGRGRERSVHGLCRRPRLRQSRSSSTSVAGTFLPPDELERARNVAVLGSKLHAELYGDGERARRAYPRGRAALSRRRRHGAEGRHGRHRSRRHRSTFRPRAASSCSIAQGPARDRRAVRGGRDRRRGRRRHQREFLRLATAPRTSPSSRSSRCSTCSGRSSTC